MKRVQDALSGIGIPVSPGAWRPTPEQPEAPDQYIVYTTMTTEDQHWDDGLIQYRIYVYLNLWSATSPTPTIKAVRAAMRAAGFEMIEEQTDLVDDTRTKHYPVIWTWVGWEVAE